MSQAVNTLNTISNQLQNLINLYIVKFINTGDRVVDGAFTIIINSAIALLGAFIYASVLDICNWFYARYVAKETDEPTNIDHRRFDYNKHKIDDISKYPFIIKLAMSSNQIITIQHVEQWCFYTYKSIHNLEKTYYTIKHVSITIEMYKMPETILKYFMPIWKYKNIKNEWEYIWLYESIIYANDREQLEKFANAIHKWIQDNKPATPDTPYIFTPTLYEAGVGVSIGVVGMGSGFTNIGKLNTARTFNHLYFDCKEQIINMLDKFTAKTLYPTGLSLDNKLGILLYGPPGTGKTGTISAIANYLKRDIIMVKTLNNETIKTLSKLNSDNAINYSNSIIVFDEFDHILCQKPAHAEYTTQYKIRELRESLMDASTEDEKKTIQAEIKKIKTDAETTGDFTMSDLITFLDGMNNATGRIIIATTNYPNKINKVLMRPGRFDLKLELGYCSMQMFKDTVATIYPDEVAALSVPTAVIDICNEKTKDHIEIAQPSLLETRINDILRKNITPLVLINTLVQTSGFNDLLSQLETLEPYAFSP